jgi:hypothetical protein
MFAKAIGLLVFSARFDSAKKVKLFLQNIYGKISLKLVKEKRNCFSFAESISLIFFRENASLFNFQLIN